MGTRGRKSVASLTVIAPARIETIERQRPPHELNDEEVEVWAAVVQTQPADWFDASNVPLLTQYCRHVIQAKRLAELIERATADPELAVSDYDKLLKMQDRESKAISSLATKMRISQQATANWRGNKKPKAVKKPWES